VNEALLAPAGTVTLAGVVTSSEADTAIDTTAPPAGATPFRVTVTWSDVPLFRLRSGLRLATPVAGAVEPGSPGGTGGGAGAGGAPARVSKRQTVDQGLLVELSLLASTRHQRTAASGKVSVWRVPGIPRIQILLGLLKDELVSTWIV
jgi:hypothetical protein